MGRVVNSRSKSTKSKTAKVGGSAKGSLKKSSGGAKYKSPGAKETGLKRRKK